MRLGLGEKRDTSVPPNSEIAKASLASLVDEFDEERLTVIALLLGERFYGPAENDRNVAGPDDADTDYHAVLAVG